MAVSPEPSSGAIWTVSGAAGVGKTTLIAGLLRSLPSARLLKRITTRPPRNSDNKGEFDYVTPEEFTALSNSRLLAWPREIHGYNHALLYTRIHIALAWSGITIVDLAVPAVEDLVMYAREIDRGYKIRSVYLDHFSDEDMLRRRMSIRGEVDIERRILNCRSWAQEAKNSFVLPRIIDARQPSSMVLQEALDFFLS